MITAFLRNRFIFAPPLLRDIIHPFTGHEHTFKLYRLFDDYLPEEKEEMRGLAPADAAGYFVKAFSRKFFLINVRSYYSDPVHQLVEGIPVDLHGMREGYYELPYNRLTPGQLLAEAICVCPFPRQERLSVIDAFRKQLGEENIAAIKLIKEGGFDLAEVEEALADSPYPGLLTRCRWLFGRTGNIWLDRTGTIEWTRENVDCLSRDHSTYQALDKEMKAFDSWLGHDKVKKYAKVLLYLRNKIPKTLVEVFKGDEDGNRD